MRTIFADNGHRIRYANQGTLKSSNGLDWLLTCLGHQCEASQALRGGHHAFHRHLSRNKYSSGLTREDDDQSTQLLTKFVGETEDLTGLGDMTRLKPLNLSET